MGKIDIDYDDRYVILMETNDDEPESWYNFIKYKGNEKALDFLNDQISKIDMELMEGLSCFDLEIENFVSSNTAKEMSKVDLNSQGPHRKFDGKLEMVNLKFKKHDSNDKMLNKLYKKLGEQRLENYISDEDVDSSDLETNSESGGDGSDSMDEYLVPLPNSDDNRETRETRGGRVEPARWAGGRRGAGVKKKKKGGKVGEKEKGRDVEDVEDVEDIKVEEVA